MGLIKIRAKVKLITEEDLEWDEEAMGKVIKDNTWVWKDKIIDTQYIYELTELTKGKTILQQTDGVLILVAETLDTLFKLWEENKEKDLDLGEELDEKFLKSEDEE